MTTQYVWNCQYFNSDGFTDDLRELEIFDTLEKARACMADIHTTHWEYHVSLDGLVKVMYSSDLDFGFVHFIEEKKEERTMNTNRFIGYETIAQACDYTDAQGYRAIESWPTLDDALIAAHRIASDSIRRNGGLLVKWVVARALVQSPYSEFSHWRVVEVIALNYTGNRIVRITSDKDGIPFDISTFDDDFGPIQREESFMDTTEDTLWRLVTSSAKHSHCSDGDTLNNTLDQLGAAKQCLENKGYSYDDDKAVYVNPLADKWITLSLVLAETPFDPQYDIVSSGMAALGMLEQVPYYSSGVSNEVRNALVSKLGYSATEADTAVIAWRLMDNGQYGWIADLANGSSFYYDHVDGDFRRPAPRAELSDAQVAELTIQLQEFTDIVDSANHRGDLAACCLYAGFVLAIAAMLG